MINLVLKIKITTVVLIVLSLSAMPVALYPATVSAQSTIPYGCPGGPPGPPAPGTVCPEDSTPSDTAEPEDSYIENDCTDVNVNQGNCGILRYLVLFINILAGIVGVVVVGSIIYAGIQYSTAGSDPQKVSAAKDRIRNALIALAFFIFMYSFLNYLVPGGVL